MLLGGRAAREPLLRGDGSEEWAPASAGELESEWERATTKYASMEVIWGPRVGPVCGGGFGVNRPTCGGGCFVGA